MLPDALDGALLRPIRPHVVYVRSELVRAQVFHVLPHAATHPLSPRALPREVVEVATAEGRKKKGRPSRRERAEKGREMLVALEGLGSGIEPAPSATRYVTARQALVDGERWDVAVRDVIGRVGTISGSF